MVRSSLGRSIELSTTRTGTGTYGFYVLPIAHLLELTEWVPHQDLLAAGKLVEVAPDDTETKVVFCSHQWTSFDAPDPTMDQLKVLQSVIRKLMAGKTDVRSNGMLDAVYQYQMRSSGSDWAKALPKMCFWLDYFSMPQPGALISEASEELKAKLDTNNDGIVSQAELADAVLAEPGEQRNAGTDHRLMSGDADTRIKGMIEDLKAAVDSIPAYVERCSMMWVLVPPVAHSNLVDSICDFASWRKRGWCRMEFAASKLACGPDMPLMVIKSAIDAPEYFNPCDIFKLCAAKGDFSIESDKVKVNATLVTMLTAKADYYEKQCDDLTLSRILKAFGPIFVPREAFGASLPTAADAAAAGETSLAALQRFMGWRGAEAEAAWEAETGWNLLTLAVAMDDEPAVTELLAGDAEAVKALLHAKGGKMFVPGMKGSKTPGSKKEAPPHRREPLGQKLTQYAEGMSPLMAAMTFASASVVTKLLDAGAPVERDGLTLLGEKPCTFRGAVTAGKHENVSLFLSRYPEYTNKIDPGGSCALHYCAWSSECLGQADTMSALMGAGAKATVGHEAPFFGAVLSTACATYDQDPAFLKMLLDAGADATQPVKLPGMVKVARRMAHVFSALGNVQMRGYKALLNNHPGLTGLTPAHLAGRRGDIATVQLLAQHSQFNTHTLKDAKGRTPIDMCAAATSREVSQLMQKAVDAAVPSAAAAAPPAKASANKASVSAPQVAPYTSK